MSVHYASTFQSTAQSSRFQWNTYGEPPNADLVRRYGYVDYVPTEDGTLGNPSDVVEISADIAVKLVDAEELEQRVYFFLDEGGEE